MLTRLLRLLCCFFLLLAAAPASASSSSTSVAAADKSQRGVQDVQPPGSRFAYAMVHYEGTSADNEYVLGMRTLIKSIQSSETPHDIVVLVAPNVREEVREQLVIDGARVKQVENIANPYKPEGVNKHSDHYQDHFEFTFNKLHLWDPKILPYERVIFMDSDFIVLHNMDELFMCGHFCAVFMNQVAFHTGLMVVKPDTAKYEDMQRALQTAFSWDGADQGFLVSYFRDLDKAPMFDARTLLLAADQQRCPGCATHKRVINSEDTSKTRESLKGKHANLVPQDMHDMRVSDASTLSAAASSAPMMRLELAYSINQVYFYEKFNWLRYRFLRTPVSSQEIPGYSMTFAIAQIVKPWYWWGHLYLDMNWRWARVRDQLEGSNDALVFWNMVPAVLIPYLILFVSAIILRKISQGEKCSPLIERANRVMVQWVGEPAFRFINAGMTTVGLSWTSMLATFPCSFLSARYAALWIPSTCPPQFAWPLFVLFQNFFFFVCVNFFSMVLSKGCDLVSPMRLLWSVVFQVSFILMCFSHIYPDFITKILFCVVGIFLSIVVQSVQIRRLFLAYVNPKFHHQLTNRTILKRQTSMDPMPARKNTDLDLL